MEKKLEDGRIFNLGCHAGMREELAAAKTGLQSHNGDKANQPGMHPTRNQKFQPQGWMRSFDKLIVSSICFKPFFVCSQCISGFLDVQWIWRASECTTNLVHAHICGACRR